MAPRKVVKDIVLSYEKRTGFVGLGEFLERKGTITMIDEVSTCYKNSKLG